MPKLPVLPGRHDRRQIPTTPLITHHILIDAKMMKNAAIQALVPAIA